MRWSRFIGLIVLSLVLIPSFGIALGAEIIEVWTEEVSYKLGDNVELEGYTNVTETVTIVITNSSGQEILSTTIDPDEDGDFQVNFIIDENTSEGIYEVNATVDNIYNITSFEVVESDDEEKDESIPVQTEGTNPCGDFTTIDDLLYAIERAILFIEKVNATTEALQEDFEMTFFWDKVNGLNESLMELYQHVSSKDFEPDDLESAVEEFCSLRKEVTQLNGLLNSITKRVKEKKALQFTERMIRRIDKLEEKFTVLDESLELEESSSVLKAHKRKLEHLWLTLKTTIAPDELETILDELESVTAGVESGLDGLGDDGYTLKEMYKVQARIEVFTATIEKMQRRNKVNARLLEKLGKANEIMSQMEEQFGELNQGKMKELIEDVNENLGGVGKTIREINKSNKGGKGKGKK